MPPTPAPAATPFTAALDRVLADSLSCLLVTDAGTGAPLYARNGDLPLAPASTQKLLVAAAALSRLGPDYRFETTVVASRPPVAGQVDDLWVVGGGDPLLATPGYIAMLQANPATTGYQPTPLSALVDGLVGSGVRAVRNGIHGDESRYDAVRYLAGWPANLNIGEFDIGPLSALELDQGLDRWRPAVVDPDPPGHAAAALGELLAGRGVRARAGGDGAPPAHPAVLARVVSAPLSQLVGAMLQASDNQIAELLVRELDRQAGGRGTTPAGLRVVQAEVQRLGVPLTGVSLVDGSGLSAQDRDTCRTLLATLNLGDTTRLAALASGLPVAGVSGGLANLFRGTPIAGRLAAKGGYITGVTSLVGRLAAPHPVRFAFVANGPFDYPGGVAFASRVVTTLFAR